MSLAADPAPGAVGPPPRQAGVPSAPDRYRSPASTAHQTASSAAITWTALAAAVVGTGLLLQVRAAPDVRVAMPVALLGCLVIAAPLAMGWRWPLAMTAALWSAAALFSPFATLLGNNFAAICLVFVPPFMVAYFEGRRRAAAGLGITGQDRT